MPIWNARMGRLIFLLVIAAAASAVLGFKQWESFVADESIDRATFSAADGLLSLHRAGGGAVGVQLPLRTLETLLDSEVEPAIVASAAGAEIGEFDRALTDADDGRILHVVLAFGPTAGVSPLRQFAALSLPVADWRKARQESDSPGASSQGFALNGALSDGMAIRGFLFRTSDGLGYRAVSGRARIFAVRATLR